MPTYSHDNPFAAGGTEPALSPPYAPAEFDVDAFAAVFADPSSLDADLVDRVVGVLVSVVRGTADRADTLDDHLAAVRVGKKAVDDLRDAYDAARTSLWSRVGPGDHATESGARFAFTAPVGRRTTDLKRLEAEYPAVYDEVVQFSEPKADAVGTLRLKKGRGPVSHA